MWWKRSLLITNNYGDYQSVFWNDHRNSRWINELSREVLVFLRIMLLLIIVHCYMIWKKIQMFFQAILQLISNKSVRTIRNNCRIMRILISTSRILFVLSINESCNMFGCTIEQVISQCYTFSLALQCQQWQ